MPVCNKTSVLLVLHCLLRPQERTGTALRIKCSFSPYPSPHTAPARGTNTFICGQAEASLSCICAFTHSIALCLRQHTAQPPIHINAPTQKCLRDNELHTHRYSGEERRTNSSQLAETESGRQTRKTNKPCATIRGAI